MAMYETRYDSIPRTSPDLILPPRPEDKMEISTRREGLIVHLFGHFLIHIEDRLRKFSRTPYSVSAISEVIGIVMETRQNYYRVIGAQTQEELVTLEQSLLHQKSQASPTQTQRTA